VAGVELRALGGTEEVRAVLHDGPAERSTELVTAVVLLVHVAHLLGLRRRCQPAIAEEREATALELVRAALGDDVHHAAVAAAVLRFVARRLEVELLEGLNGKARHEAPAGVFVVVAAVDLVVDVPAVAAADLRRELRALRRIGVEAEADAPDAQRQAAQLPA